MAMSLNTLPQIPLNTQSSPDGSSILSSDSSKPTLSNHTFSTSASNVPQPLDHQTNSYQTIKAAHTIQPFTSAQYSTSNLNNINQMTQMTQMNQMSQMSQMNQLNSNPFASSNISRADHMLNFADCDADPLPIGFRDDHNFSITDMSFSSLYGMNQRQNHVEFDDNTNSNNNNNNNNTAHPTNNNCTIYSTNNNNDYSTPFTQNNSNNNTHPFTVDATHDNTFCSPFNTADATDFTCTSNQVMQAQNNAFNPYYNIGSAMNNNNNNMNIHNCSTTVSDPRIVSFAPGRPRPGASSQICCVTAPQNTQDCMPDTAMMNTKMIVTAPPAAINGNILPIESSNNNQNNINTLNCCNYTEQFSSNNNNTVITAPRANNGGFTSNNGNNNNRMNGEYVYNANGDVIGVLEGRSNIITSNTGQCNTMRPLVLPPIDQEMSNNATIAIPPIIRSNRNSSDCNFTVLDIHHPKLHLQPQQNDKYCALGDKSMKGTKTEANITVKGAVKQVKTITRSTMKRGRHISSAEKPFVCETCGKGYKYLCNYRSHCKIHTDDAFVCNFCNKRFGRKSNYKEHVRIHTGEAPYKCQFCERTFKQHHGWKDHLRVHTGEKPYLCKVCGKRFTVGHNLNVHMRIHTGERPYTCDICKKSYRQKSAYNSHIKNVHGIKVQRKPKTNIIVVDKKENVHPMQ